MPNVGNADAANPASIVELSQQEIEAMMAEAMAVDVLLQKMRPGSYDIVLSLMTCLSFSIRSRKDRPISSR
jgi:hypothetical protein